MIFLFVFWRFFQVFILREIVFIVFLNFSAICFIHAMDTDEAVLKKSASNLTHVHGNEHSMSDDEFDEIFSKVYMVQFKTKSTRSVGQITIDMGNSDKYGTGTIIGWDDKNKTIRVITAKHVVAQKGFSNNGIKENITFKLGNSAISKDNPSISYLAKFSEDAKNRAEIFFHNSLDVAYIDFSLNSHLNQLIDEEENIKDNILSVDHSHINRGKVRYVYHYPWGKSELRLNGGTIKSDKQGIPQKKYEVDTMPGSSGAPVVVDERLIGIHTQEGDPSGEFVEYDGKRYNLTHNNTYVSMIYVDFNDFKKVKRS